MDVGVSREQFHRLIDDLPAEKLPSVAKLIRILVDEDDEPISAEELSQHLRIRDEMLLGKYVTADKVFSER